MGDWTLGVLNSRLGVCSPSLLRTRGLLKCTLRVLGQPCSLGEACVACMAREVTKSEHEVRSHRDSVCVNTEPDEPSFAASVAVKVMRGAKYLDA
jgi:hypothetical protein